GWPGATAATNRACSQADCGCIITHQATAKQQQHDGNYGCICAGWPRPVGPLRPVPKPSNIISRQTGVMSKQAPLASRLHGLNKGVLSTPSPLKRPGSMLKSGIKPIESILGTVGQLRKKDELGTPQKRKLGGGARGGVARGGKSTAKMIHKGATVVPRTTLSSTLGVMNTDLDNIKLESYAGGTGEPDVVVGLPDDFPPLGDLPPITPDSPPRPLTLCPLTGRVLARAEGEPTPRLRLQGGYPHHHDHHSRDHYYHYNGNNCRPATYHQGEMSSQEIPANVEPATVSVRKVASRSRA
ncbi:uncharacterized protein LOC111050105, partial [Nilaparvata lugens]|uniref:uncharacterized protein LOC111050105 n=1 Tax=Nilaparvata lugens TaxID=108931 RepID=UPI00193D7F57